MVCTKSIKSDDSGNISKFPNKIVCCGYLSELSCRDEKIIPKAND